MDHNSDTTLHEVGQVSRRLGVSAATIRNRIDAGDITAVRTAGGQRLVAETELKRVLALSRAPHDE
ncbi:MAG: excisionase family DNA-binding protein [Acidobacteria bacterium]|nr:excisionase family DNA-binding protein [Acidobacteriota bacterium]